MHGDGRPLEGKVVKEQVLECLETALAERDAVEDDTERTEANVYEGNRVEVAEEEAKEDGDEESDDDEDSHGQGRDAHGRR